MEDMSDVIDLLESGTYMVTRPAGETFVDGVAVPGTPTTFPITASIQPLGGLEIQRLPDGFRNGEAKSCFTSTKLRTLDATMPDAVLVDGLQFQVQSCEDWSALGNYYRAVLVRPAS